jgi:hypothetical protein
LGNKSFSFNDELPIVTQANYSLPLSTILSLTQREELVIKSFLFNDKLPIVTLANYSLPLNTTLSSYQSENLGLKRFSLNETIIFVTQANYKLPFNLMSSMFENENLAVIINFTILNESHDCNSLLSEVEFTCLSLFMYFALCLLVSDVFSNNEENKNEDYDLHDDASLLNFTLEFAGGSMDSLHRSSSVDCDTHSFLFGIDGDDCLSSTFFDNGVDVPDDASLLNYSLESDDIDDIFCTSSIDDSVSYSFLFGIDDDDEWTSVVSVASSTSSAFPVIVTCSRTRFLIADDDSDISSVHSLASSASVVLPAIVKCSSAHLRRSARIAKLPNICYKKFF